MTMLAKVQIWSSFLLIILVAGMLCACRSPAPEVANNGEELPTYQMEIDLLGARHEVLVDVQGRLKTNVELSSANGIISLSLKEGTIVLDKDGKPLEFVHIESEPTLPLPPEGAYIVGTVYDLTPHGATFDPPLKVTISYEPEELPEGARESEVYIAPYDESTGWGRWHYKRVDTNNHRVTTQVNYFARYAVLVPGGLTPSAPSPKPDLAPISLEQALASGKPTLAEFGSGTCSPCKMMKPILEELAVEYKDEVNVVIVEVYEERELTSQHEIMAIPTQIFFDSSGKEVTRHMGFWPKEEIIAQLKEMGID